jgi:hypothetical protein
MARRCEWRHWVRFSRLIWIELLNKPYAAPKSPMHTQKASAARSRWPWQRRKRSALARLLRVQVPLNFLAISLATFQKLRCVQSCVVHSQSPQQMRSNSQFPCLAMAVKCRRKIPCPTRFGVQRSVLMIIPLAVRAGGDRDTICAIVGGVVASYVGLHGIPEAWLSRREPLPNWHLPEAKLS